MTSIQSSRAETTALLANERTLAATRRFLSRHPGVVRLGVIILLLVVWEIAARFLIDPLFISPPSRVFTSLGNVLDTEGVPNALRISAWEIMVAFAMSVVIGPVRATEAAAAAENAERNTEFMKLYYDNDEFRKAVKEAARKRAYRIITDPLREEALARLRAEMARETGGTGA